MAGYESIGTPTPQPVTPSWSKKKIIVGAVVAAFGFTSLCYFVPTKHQLKTNFCPKPEPFMPVFDKSLDKIFNSSDWQLGAIDKLSGAVQIPTEVGDDYTDPARDLSEWQWFFHLHDYLETAFPLVHEHLTKEKVNEIGLLYTWQGTDPDLKPLLLMAHQDVVPVNNATLEQWNYPPFSGHYDGERIWGRGTADTKLLLISELLAVEQLLNDGFKPKRTVLLAFGNDEESSGRYSAKSIANTIIERYGPDSLYAIFDEGGRILPLDDNTYLAGPVTTEKGYLDLEIELYTTGGHSSIPPKHTAIGIASDLITLLEKREYGVYLDNSNPVLKTLQCEAEHLESMEEDLRTNILLAASNHRAKHRLIKYMHKIPALRYLIGTSQAIDVIKGGIKSNALPESVSFLINQRIALDSTPDDVIAHVMSSIKVIASKYGLGIDTPGINGYFKVQTVADVLSPAPLTPSEGKIWDILTGTIVNTLENGLFKSSQFEFANKKVIVAPSLSTGNTDTRYYWKLTKNIFRFGCSIWRPTTGAHTVNENIYADQLISSTAFLYQLIGNMQ